VRRVAVTGLGCLTAAGADVAATWEAVLAGRSAVRSVAPGRLAADIAGVEARDLVADRKLLKVISRQDAVGLNAAEQAIAHAGLAAHREALADPAPFNDRTGVFVGSPATKYRQQHDYLPALAAAGGDARAFAASAMEVVHPMWLLRTLPNNVLAYVGIGHGFKGANENVTGHGVSGTQALAEACRYLREGVIDRAVVVGYDSVAEPEALVYYAAMGLIGTQAPAPFDRDRDGTILGEGAGAVVLEDLDQARARNATIHGEVLGCSVLAEAGGILAVRDDGDGPLRAMRAALADAGRQPEQVGAITAHANGTRASDASEARAIVELFGPDTVPVTGFKWSFGHTVAASGVIESVLTLLALRQRKVPGIATLRRLAPDCAGLRASAALQQPRSALGLVVARGFAGLNSCVVLSTDVA
jgi:3-oxoacyl-[acyl-carrier-protein] synthase-1